jgi:tetratricopeptide (TPR) repeat protein
MTAIPKNRILAPKDASNFRASLKLYESKQYKKALKGVEAVLKKNPDHGESLSLKGLVLYFMGKKDEGYEFVKKGLANDITSYVCWHIHGLYHRQEKNYEEATKCYSRALQLDPENQNVLRDLSGLQMQVRLYDALVVSRKKMLTDKPGFRQNWTALAVAQHLSGDYKGAETTLANFEKLVKEPLPKSDGENSELMLYKNLIIYESGDVERALADLESIAGKVLDVQAVNENRAKYLLELGRKKDAEREYRLLIKRNPECAQYYEALEKTLGIDKTDVSLRVVLYNRLAAKYPKADAPRSIPLNFLNGPQFKDAVAKYITGILEREVPSTFVMVKPLYKDAEKRQAIEEFILEFYSSLNKQEKSNGTTETVMPTTLLWTIYFLAQHYSYLNKHELALEYIDKAIAHTPTLLELHMMKAKILKHAGDIGAASNSMVHARELDLQDRFINTKAGKYLLRADRMDDAIDTISLFTKNDSNGKGVQDLHDMQGTWFLNEQAESYARVGNFGLALKRFHAVIQIFEDFKNDQFDFHFYCPRRGTIRAYLTMISWARSIYADPVYVRAATGAINIYLRIHRDQTDEADGLCAAELEGLDEAEKKKALKKAKKDKAKELKKQHEEREKSDSTDPDMFGQTLLATTTPVDDAYKIWKPLGEQAGDNHDTWELAFEIYLAQQKYILAMQALSKAKAAGSRESWILSSAVRVRFCLEADENAPAALRAVQLKTLPTIVEKGLIVEDDLNVYVEQYIQGSGAAVLDWCNAKITVNKGISNCKAAIEGKVMAMIVNPTANLDYAVKAYQLLKSFRSSRLAEYREAALKLWPRATVFN